MPNQHFLTDRRFRVPRLWSNQELRKFSRLFHTDVVNVSAWKDEDKEGDLYRNYFNKALSYTITNFNTETYGSQGLPGELFLDLEQPLPKELKGKFGVVFNHTTLEHVYDFRQAFVNLCDLSSDIVIIVVPFLQQMHAPYGDFWRFTPLAIKKMFEEQHMELLYLSFNEHPHSSVYLFCIASKHPERWNSIKKDFSFTAMKKSVFDPSEPYVGNRAITNNIVYQFALCAEALHTKIENLLRFKK